MPESSPSSSTNRLSRGIIVDFALMLVSTAVGQWLFRSGNPDSVSTFCPEAATALFLVWRSSGRGILIVFITSFAVRLLCMQADSDVLARVSIEGIASAGLALQALVGRILLKQRPVENPGGWTVEVLLVQSIACLVQPTLESAAIANLQGQPPELFIVWTTGFLANLNGIFLLFPSVYRTLMSRFPESIHTVLICVVIISVWTGLLLLGHSHPSFTNVLAFCAFPVLVCLAVRKGSTASSLSLVALLVIMEAIAPGNFSEVNPASPWTRIVHPLFCFLLGLTVLSVANLREQFLLTELEFRHALELAEIRDAQFRNVVEYAPEAIVVFDYDLGRFTDANPNAVRLFELSRETIIRMHLSELSPDFQDEGRASVEAAEVYLDKALNEGSVTFEWLHKRSNGETFPCEVRLTRLPSNNQRLLRASIVDISERRRLEDRLRGAVTATEEISQRLQLALRSGNVGLWSWNLKSNTVTYSDQFKMQLGYDADYIMDHYEDWESRLHPDDREKAVKTVRDYLEGVIPNYSSVFRMKHRTGAYRWILSQGELVPASASQSPRMLGMHLDITDRKKIQDELEAYARTLESRNKELKSFAYVASHDLKAPLRSVRQLAEWVLEDAEKDLPDEPREYLRQIIERVDHLDTLLNDLLVFSRAGRLHGARSDIVLQTFLEETLQLIPHSENFVLSIDADDASFETFATPLQQVLMNLVTNAVRHHDRERGHILISARDQGESIKVSVEDDGPGIAECHHERIFEIFETLTPSGTPGSTGIGLAIVRKILDAYGGEIEVHSVPGKGSRFDVLWPKSIESLPSEERETKA